MAGSFFWRTLWLRNARSITQAVKIRLGFSRAHSNRIRSCVHGHSISRRILWLRLAVSSIGIPHIHVLGGSRYGVFPMASHICQTLSAPPAREFPVFGSTNRLNTRGSELPEGAKTTQWAWAMKWSFRPVITIWRYSSASSFSIICLSNSLQFFTLHSPA